MRGYDCVISCPRRPRSAPVGHLDLTALLEQSEQDPARPHRGDDHELGGAGLHDQLRLRDVRRCRTRLKAGGVITNSLAWRTPRPSKRSARSVRSAVVTRTRWRRGIQRARAVGHHRQAGGVPMS